MHAIVPGVVRYQLIHHSRADARERVPLISVVMQGNFSEKILRKRQYSSAIRQEESSSFLNPISVLPSVF